MNRKITFAFHKRLNIVYYSFIAIGAMSPGLLFLIQGHTLVWRDTSKLFQPIRPLVVEALRNFELPLWNPHEALGIPLFAQLMHSILHPVSVLACFLFPGAGLDVHILAYSAFASVGSALLARTLGVSLGASAVAGLGYGLSGYVLGMSSIIQYLAAAATAPWTVAGLRMGGEGRRFGTVFASIATAVLHFVGDPQWTIIAIMMGVILAMEARSLIGLKNAFFAVVIGTALAAVQLIPAGTYLGETSRAINLDIVDRMQWAFSPWRLIELVAPGFFGSVSAGLAKWPVFTWLGGPSRPWLEMPFAPSVYVGACILLLAIAGIKHSRVTLLLGLLSLILLWLALGANAGAEQLMHSLPVWGKLRYAEKMIGPLTLCLSVLAAFGSERLSKHPSKSWLAFVGATSIGSLLFVLLLASWQNLGAMFENTIAHEAATQARHNLIIGLIYTGSTLLVLACFIAGARRWSQLRTNFAVAVAVLIFLDLSFAAPFALHAGAGNILDGFPLSQLKRLGGPIRMATPFEENYHYPKGLDEYDAQIWGQSRLGVPSYNVPSRVDQFNTYTGLRPWRFDLILGTFRERFGIQSVLALRRFAVTHMIIKNPFSAYENEVAATASDGGTVALENFELGFVAWSVPHRPWASFADRVILVPGEKEALDTLIEKLVRGESTVVLEGAPLPKALGSGKVLNIERSSNRLRIEAVSDNDGILVVNDSYWPGWKAKIDGTDVPIWPADFLVRAVPWPKGRHVLEMRYAPTEVRIGSFITLAGAIALAALLVTEWYGHRPASGHTRKRECSQTANQP